jgi:MYXO-CTERM domain-containing protein
MKAAFFRPPALCLLLAATSLLPARAAIVSLTSPDGKWRLASDEFGAYGIAATNSSAQRDFGDGLGLTEYSWASSLFLMEGGTRQWVTGIDLDFVGQTLLTAGNVLSDSTVGSVRTSAFSVPNFANLRIDLIQSVTNAGITQQFSFTNNRLTSMTFSVVSFHDVDLDENTAGNDIIALNNGTMQISEGGRNLYFSPAAPGYVGYLAATTSGGITTNLDAIAFNNFGIPAGAFNQFRNVDSAVLNGSTDLNNDKISDVVGDVGYLFQNNLTIPAGGTVVFNYGTQAVPEPSSALLGLFGASLLARRRRR